MEVAGGGIPRITEDGRPLTKRQAEVHYLRGLGFDDAEVAVVLGIARATVRSLRTPAHMARAGKHPGAHDRSKKWLGV